jgi:hypothetical protein
MDIEDMHIQKILISGININFSSHLPIGQVNSNLHLSEWKIILSEFLKHIPTQPSAIGIHSPLSGNSDVKWCTDICSMLSKCKMLQQ